MARPSRMWLTSPRALRPVTESLQPGATAPEPDERAVPDDALTDVPADDGDQGSRPLRAELRGALWTIVCEGHPMTDRILLNGRFNTLDPANSSATAVAVEDSLFAAAGDDREI